MALRGSGESGETSWCNVKFMTAVFSYNRGQLLDNCVRSIEEFSPDTHITVFDDQSDEPETIETLRANEHEDMR